VAGFFLQKKNGKLFEKTGRKATGLRLAGYGSGVSYSLRR
jgi:hypothetical protein